MTTITKQAMLSERQQKSGRKNRTLHLMLLPAVILTIIFCYLPMGGLVIAFQDFDPAVGFWGEQTWCGLDNFRFLLNMPDIWQVTFNTLYMAVCKIIFGQLLAIVMSILLNELTCQTFKRLSQTAIYLPYFISWVVLSGIFIDILSPSTGLINQCLKFFGLEPIYFLGDKTWFPITMIITDCWKGFGFGTVIYMATIANIPQDLYEVATVDGASRWQKIWHITLAGMKMIIVLIALLNLGTIFSANFDQIFNMYSPQVYQTGDVLDTLIYRMGLEDMQFGISTAAGFLKSAVSGLLISATYYLAYKFADYRIF